MFTFKKCVCLRMVEDCKFSVLAEQNSFILQYTSMFNKQNIIILMESPFHNEDFGATFSHVDSSMHEL